MSEAACKTILCGRDSIATIQNYLIDHDNAGKELQKAANAALWQCYAALDITQLLTSQPKLRTITFTDAHGVIEAMEQIEDHLTPLDKPAAIQLLNTQAAAMRAGIEYLHRAVTGESSVYSG